MCKEFKEVRGVLATIDQACGELAEMKEALEVAKKEGDSK